MNRYRVINLETKEKVCGFYSNATDWDGLLYHVNGWAKGNLPWQWELQEELFGEWKSVIVSRSSPEYEDYKKNLSFWKRFTGIGVASFEEFSSRVL
jgi:hypothetical protein